MKLSCGNILNLKRGEIRVFYGEITLDHDDTIRAWISCPGKAECLSVEGHDYLGGWFDKLDKKASAGIPKRLWFYVKAPDEAGKYNGTITVTTTARKVLANLAITLNVSSEPCCGDQFANPEDLTRLFWLNSTLAKTNEVPKPYLPLEYEGGTAKLLGREVSLDEYGLPKRITSHFDKKLKLTEESFEILSEKIKFTVGDESFKIIASGYTCENDVFSFSSVSESDSFMMKTSAKIEFDGFCDYKIMLIAKRDTTLDNVKLCLPISEYSREYFMGLGKRGGKFNGELDFKWSADKNQDNFWVGSLNAGIRVKFKSENYRKPIIGEHYSEKPLNVPFAWDNDGKGGIRCENGAFVAYSGERKVSYGEKLNFNFEIAITPAKPIEYTADDKPIKVLQTEPYENYPHASSNLAAELKTARSLGECVLLKYSLNKFSLAAPEFTAFSDFDNELFEAATIPEGALANGESRLCNFYIEGLNHLTESLDFDGIYLEGAAFDRATAKRARNILDRRPDALIKLRFDNDFSEKSGSASAILNYLELIPYLNSIEIPDEPEKSYDYRLVELSGIPFGIKNKSFKNFPGEK